MKYNCVIVDDEPLAIDIMVRLIDSIPDLVLLESFQNPLEALSYVNEASNVHVLFLDINMPKLSGLDLPQYLNDSQIAVVFVSAYDQYALKSYEINAVDYLMKPVSIERLLKTLAKIQERFSASPKNTNETADSFFFVKSDQQTVKINVNDVLCFEGLKDYVNIKMVDGSRIVSRESLKFIESKLAAQNFIRVHRSYVINFQHITSVDNTTVKVGEHNIPIGQSYKEQLSDLIKKNVIGDRNK